MWIYFEFDWSGARRRNESALARGPGSSACSRARVGVSCRSLTPCDSNEPLADEGTLFVDVSTARGCTDDYSGRPGKSSVAHAPKATVT